MTDNEIINALELCSADECWCDDCPYENLCTDTDITKFALDLINRQKAEIERLEQEKGQFEADVEMFTDIGKMYSELKAEAVKEFAEKLKEYVESYDVTTGYRVTIVQAVEEETIDNLVKEMVGADNG